MVRTGIARINDDSVIIEEIFELSFIVIMDVSRSTGG